jgi:hypothetical protein
MAKRIHLTFFVLSLTCLQKLLTVRKLLHHMIIRAASLDVVIIKDLGIPAKHTESVTLLESAMKKHYSFRTPHLGVHKVARTS